MSGEPYLRWRDGADLVHEILEHSRFNRLTKARTNGFRTACGSREFTAMFPPLFDDNGDVTCVMCLGRTK